MNTLILISVLPIVLLYLGLYKAQKALLPVAVVGLLAALGLAISQWNNGAQPIYHGMMLFDNYSIAFCAITITINNTYPIAVQRLFRKDKQPHCRILRHHMYSHWRALWLWYHTIT